MWAELKVGFGEMEMEADIVAIGTLGCNPVVMLQWMETLGVFDFGESEFCCETLLK